MGGNADAKFRYKERNRTKINAQSREYRKNNRRAAKNTRLKADYGITIGQFELLGLQQHGVCAACGCPPCKRGLCVDHCHESGLVRGLLCFSCNIALGVLKESPTRMDALKAYINHFIWIKA